MLNCILKHVNSDHSIDLRSGQQQFWTRRLSSRYDDFTPPLQILSFGAEDWGRGRQYQREHSEMFGIEYVREGDAEFVQNGKSYHVTAGEVYILRSGVSHRYGTGPGGHLRKYYIAISGALLESLLLACGMESCDYVRPDSPVEIEEIFLSIRSIMHDKPPGFALELSQLAYRLIVALSRSTSQRFPVPIRTALEFIDRNLNRMLTTGEICEAAGLSRTHFNRLFHHHVGLSPKQFFIRHKMAWARHLLRESVLAIKQISATLGYDDPLYFSSQFRLHVGMSPKQYRQREPAK